MPRAPQPNNWQTAAAPEENASGCFSFLLPPITVIFISTILASLALKTPVQAKVVHSIPDVASTTDIPAIPLLSPTPIILTPTETVALPTLTATPLPETNSPDVIVPTTETSSPDFILPTVETDWLPVIISTPASGAIVASGLAPLFRPEVLYWSDSIIRWSSASALDPNLAAVIMQIESCGDPRALSRSGAMGLFQVMPFHFYATDSPYDPDTNAARGLAYLARSLEAARGDARLAMAGYNGGIGVISRAEWTWPAETKRYVYYGAPMYADAQQGLSTSIILDEWYQKYGAGLCRQARSRLGLVIP